MIKQQNVLAHQGTNLNRFFSPDHSKGGPSLKRREDFLIKVIDGLLDWLLVSLMKGKES